MSKKLKLGGPRKIDLPAGFRSNCLVVIKEIDGIRYSNGRIKRRYLCQCDCGNRVPVRLERLLDGSAKSCGHGSKKAKIRCHICDKVFKSKVSLSNHINIAHKEEDITYVCSKCGKLFTTDKSIKPGRLIKCEECRMKRPHSKEGLTSIKQMSKRTVSKVLYRAGLGCSICGWSKASCDIHHIVPVSKGGGDENENLIVVCPNCHREIHRGVCEKDEKYMIDHSIATQWDAIIKSYHPKN